MSEVTTCASCSGPCDPDGACPRCLMMVGLDSNQTDATLTPVAVDPDRIPGFEIIRMIGRGGMGAVFEARQERLDRTVAIKILAPEIQHRPGFAERFRREARTMAGLNHPNLVSIHDSGEDDELFWLVMEHVDGVNLRQLMEEGVTSAQALDLVRQTCDALHYAHEEGVVHRDIKPENILVDRRGRVKLGDFGLAKILDGDSPVSRRLTGTHHVMGTPLYMAPEQINHPKDVDHRADIYSLGVVFYELLTGELPLGRFLAPSEAADADARLDDVVLRALERKPADRYQHASEVRADLDTLNDEAPAGERAKAPASSAKAHLEVRDPAGDPGTLAPPKRPRPSLPTWITWWELPLCVLGVIATIPPWTRSGRAGALDGSGPWALMVGGAFLLPLVVWVTTNRDRRSMVIPWACALAGALAGMAFTGAITSTSMQSPTAFATLAFVICWLLPARLVWIGVKKLTLPEVVAVRLAPLGVIAVAVTLLACVATPWKRGPVRDLWFFHELIGVAAVVALVFLASARYLFRGASSRFWDGLLAMGVGFIVATNGVAFASRSWAHVASYAAVCGGIVIGLLGLLQLLPVRRADS